MIQKVAIPALVAATLVGCTGLSSRDRPSGALRSADYFPLSPRSHWTYHVEDFATGWTYDRTLVVSGRASVPGYGEAAVVEETFSASTEPLPELPVVPVGYVWREGYLERLFLDERDGVLEALDWPSSERVLPDTVAAGHTWSGGGDETAEDFGFAMGNEASRRFVLPIDMQHRIASVTERVTVPGGSFRGCLRIDIVAEHGRVGAHEGVRFFYSDWYAPGVGLVRSQVWDDASKSRERVRIELVEHEIR